MKKHDVACFFTNIVNGLFSQTACANSKKVCSLRLQRSCMEKKFVTLFILLCCVPLLIPLILVVVCISRTTKGGVFDDKKKYSAIIVLGNPANADGTPSAILRSRLDVAIGLVLSGKAPRVLFTGGKAHNSFGESAVMRQYAISRGISPDIIIEESQSRYTVDNARFCKRIIDENGWGEVIVVTSAYHARRTDFIFGKFSIKFTIVPVETPPGTGLLRTLFLYVWDLLVHAKYVLLGDESFPKKQRQLSQN